VHPLGLLAVLIFGAAGTVDLYGHALFGFESNIEALLSPSHLFLFTGWFLILFAPIRAARARNLAMNTQGTIRSMLPQLFCCNHNASYEFFPNGFNPLHDCPSPSRC